jgi:hypothetical protein
MVGLHLEAPDRKQVVSVMALPWISGKVLEIFNLPEMAFLTARVF